MATRRTPIRQWEVDKAQANKLIRRLMRHIMADGFPPDPKPTDGPPAKPVKSPLLNDSQVRACLGLLKKYMPDLKSIEHTGNPDHPVIHEIRRTIIDPRPADAESVSPPADPE